MKKKVALITGITGQGGSYLAELLLSKNYIVHGIKRRASSFNTERIDHIYIDPHKKTNFYLHYGDLTDSNNILNIIKKIKPDEIYNLAAQSHVATSFEMPDYTVQVNSLGALRILEAIRVLELNKKTKYYQASSSEMFGKIQKKKQNEKTNFYPLSPYATSKLFAFWITRNYREAYGIYACNGILFNHESPRRGETFVTRKISMTLSKIALGLETCLYLGNIYALRDWGYAKDYAEIQWKMMQQKKPDDYVVATGKQYSVKFFVDNCCKYLGIDIIWKGKGLKEYAEVKKIRGDMCPKIKIGQKIVKIDKKYFRPLDVENLIGDMKKANKELGWKSKTSIHRLIKDMMYEDYKKINLKNQLSN
ncbi:GDP-mannose 4,6-dehydratase [bacterium]|jgi:GDPmannose 4,6-dehydratase|nr:GDP-mannose 4,6-dehydratase [bacterium]|tara:strand:+ start:413 stop:1501 length:1089 start_codon:yes stop_codon:yes gene_type:complete